MPSRGPVEDVLPFISYEVDCFGPLINKTDAEVGELLSRLHNLINVQGEYDQDDVSILPWDDAADLLTIAETLWKHR